MLILLEKRTFHFFLEKIERKRKIANASARFNRTFAIFYFLYIPLNTKEKLPLIISKLRKYLNMK